MEAIEAIHTRRSVRKFEERAVDDETIEKLLHAAMMAPSARNQQPWHFVVLRESTTLRKIAEGCPNAGMAAGAPMAVLVCADTERELTSGYLPQDCAAAVQNMPHHTAPSPIARTSCGNSSISPNTSCRTASW